MRKVIFHLAVACTTFAVSTYMTNLWTLRCYRELPSTAHREQPFVPSPHATGEADLAQIYRNYADAQTRHDRAFFERVEADEFMLFSEGETFSRSQDIELMNNASADIVYKIDNLKFEVQGEGAIVSGRMSATDNSGDIEYWRFIDVCVKRNGRWQILSTTQL
jgi:hypothetical protein